MAHEILTAWFPLHTLKHKKPQRTKQKVFHQTKLDVFLRVLILHGLNSSCDLCTRVHRLTLSRYLAVALVFSSTGLPTLILFSDQYVPTSLSFEGRVLNGSGRAGRGPNVYLLCKTGYYMNYKAESTLQSLMEIAYTHYKMSAYFADKDDIDNRNIQKTTA